MNLLRDGRLTNSDIETGDRLLLELYATDVLALTEFDGPKQIGVRISGLRRKILSGWDLMDKIQVDFEDKGDPSGNAAPITLRLDPGGDLYFRIYDNPALRQVDQNRIYELDRPDIDDPNNRLIERGVGRVAVIGLGFFQQVLDDPFFKRQDWI
jgi:hypothetical protein